LNGWNAVIGLEVHAQLSTRTKLFCRCEAGGAGAPNRHVCPVCLGLPGALPVPNREAIRLAVRAALALGCEVRERSVWARKSYFYPDLPKGYQITQDAEPLAVGGRVRIETPEGERRWIRVERLHVEEDAGKSVHGRGPDQETGIDHNRCGHPLIEIVGAAEIRDPEHARRYLERLRAVLIACGVCRGDMESGALRCDANVSVHRAGERWGERVEVKNLNSLRFLRRALAHEIERQILRLEGGDPVERETRAWDESAGRTRLLRSKEEEPDYRYFPDPDLPALVVDEALREDAAREMPELPHETADRLVREHAVGEDDAYRLTLEPSLAAYFERAAATAGDGRAAAGWVLSELTGRARELGRRVDETLVPAARLGELVAAVCAGRLTRPAAKQVLDEMVRSGGRPEEVAERLGLQPLGGPEEVDALCRRVIAGFPEQVEQYRAGKGAVLGFLIGRAMRASDGRADPRAVRQALQRLLGD
jgi:aspartyl-tRNA(Asn)/glutamyl-tRNA(Gln) amidotransferase subunit B